MDYTRRLVAAALTLLACACAHQDDGDAGLSQGKAGLFSLFDPTAASPTIPFPFDGLFAGSTDSTLNIPNAGAVPFVRDANLQDGFSTTASIFTDFIGFLDFSSLTALPLAQRGLLVIDVGNPAAPVLLTPGVDYTVQPSPAVDSSGHPISAYRTRVLIEPLKPLKPSTRYLVAITAAAKSTDGINATAADLFRVVRSATPVASSTEPVVATLNPTQKATLETLRSTLIRPLVQALEGPPLSLPEESLVLVWSFTTQSVGDTLQALQAAATAQPMTAAKTPIPLSAINAALPNIADIYTGTLDLPYYLLTSGGDVHSTAPITGYWKADPAQAAAPKSFLGNPCSVLARSDSTTACFPLPKVQATVTVPVLMTIPNASSGKSMPAAGWPVVIFQHGITGDRSNMFGLALAMSQAGFAVVAIDLPLHGITDPASPLRVAGAQERTFDLDLQDTAGNTVLTGDGVPDPSGAWFINLNSLVTSRDNLRQAEADLMTLAKSVGGITLTGAPAGTQLDGATLRYVGHSLGGIVGGTFLGLNSDVGAATLAMPGGGVAKLLDGSGAFGPRIAAGLAANHVNEGSDDYETFLRFAQTLLDSGDPINYAAAAGVAHPIHMIEVINDGVVPNNALARDTGAAGDKVLISGYLSGTDPLALIMGQGAVGPLDINSLTPQKFLGPDAHNKVVKFQQGGHGSILQPAAATAEQLAVTTEMQTEVACYLGSNGAILAIGGAPCTPALPPI